MLVYQDDVEELQNGKDYRTSTVSWRKSVKQGRICCRATLAGQETKLLNPQCLAARSLLRK